MRIALAVMMLWVLGAVPAWAVLGEHESSVSLDQQYLRGVVRTEARQGYMLHEITAADGMVVREYVSPAGRVFGITWQGRTMPNLEQLLGSHYAAFQQASQSRMRRHGPLTVRTEQLVVESGGHPRSFHGRAYVPSLLPENISAEVVR